MKNGSNKKGKPSFPTAANLALYEAWNEPSLHGLARKTCEKKKLDGHIVTRDSRFILTLAKYPFIDHRARTIMGER